MLKNKLILTSFLIFSGFSFAQTAYISDQLEAPMRSGATDRYRIIKMVKSGDKAQISNKSGDYVEITVNGTKGWIHKRFLMNEPAAREFVEQARNNFEPLQEEIKTLKQTIIEKDQMIADLTRSNTTLKASSENHSTQLAYLEETYKNAVQIDNKNKELEQKNIEQSNLINRLEKENSSLKEDKRSDEWMKGGGLILAGILFGTSILPRLLRYRNQKKNWNRY